MKEKIYYYAYKPTNENIEATLNHFINKYDWIGLIELNPNLENILKEIINKLIWYKNYQDDIRNKTNKNLTQKEINQKYVEFVDRVTNELRSLRRYLDENPINIDLPNTSPSILKELEDILKNSKFSQKNISKILDPLKEFSGVDNLRGNEVYQIKKGTNELIDMMIHNQNGTIKEFLKNRTKKHKK